MLKEELFQLKFTADDIEVRRKYIRDNFIMLSENVRSGNVINLAQKDLKILFALYDKSFFMSYFSTNNENRIKFSLSQRMLRSAGKTIFTRRTRNGEESYEIRMAVNLFAGYNEVDREKVVNGIKTKDLLNAFQLVFEHELCHLLEFYVSQKSSCKGARFKALSRNIFGHLDVFHELPTSREIVGEKLGYKVGNRITFNFKGNKVTGLIYAINKRATVMVEDKNGEYKDRRGKRYKKWYVPLDLIDNV